MHDYEVIYSDKGKVGKVDEGPKSIYGSLDPPQKRNEIFTRMLNGFFKPPEPLKHYYQERNHFTSESVQWLKSMSVING